MKSFKAKLNWNLINKIYFINNLDTKRLFTKDKKKKSKNVSPAFNL